MASWPTRRATAWDDPLKAYIDEADATKRDISAGIPVGDLVTTGVRSSSTFLRGDGAWVTLEGTSPGGTGDTTPPSTPANLRVLENRSTSARIGWDSSTDNVNVTGYEISIGGVVQAGPVATLFAELSGLSPSTIYSVTIRARDAAGNFSPPTAPLIFTTLAAASLGYPDASNSPFLDGEGVLHYFPNFPTDNTEATQTLTPYSGLMFSTADNQVIEGFMIDGGSIIIRHNNVTVRRCYVKASTTYFSAIVPQSGATVAASTNYHPLVEDCCFDGNDVPGGTGLLGIGLTVRRCNIFRWDNGGQGEDGQTWQDNFFHDAMTFADEAHTDLIQFDGTTDWPVRNWTCTHNTMLSRTVDNQGTTSCIITNQDPMSGHMENILIEDNVFAGGAFSVYGPTRLMTDFALNNNKFWTLYYPTVGAFGPSGNDVDLMNTAANSVGAFSGGLVNNVITGSWVHDHYIGDPGPTSDTTPPTVPNGLASADISATGFTVTWSPSSDNVGVTGYEVFLDGVSQGVVTVTSKTFTGLDSGTEYAVTVRARDAAANWSDQSSALNVTTQTASSFVIKSTTVSSTSPTAGTQSVTTGEDIATEVGDLVLLFQFSDFRLMANTGLPQGTGSNTATEIDFPGTDNATKFRASYYVATVAGAQTITAVSTPGDDDKRLVAIVISGVNGADPVNIFNSVDAESSVAGGPGENFYETPTVTTDAASLIFSVTAISNGRTFVDADGYTLLKTENAVGGFITYAIVYAVQSAPGATGVIQQNFTSTGINIVGLTLALNPA